MKPVTPESLFNVHSRSVVEWSCSKTLVCFPSSNRCGLCFRCAL